MAEERAATTKRAAAACIFLLECGCARLVYFQTVIVEEFFARLEQTQGVNKNAVAFLDSLAVRFTGMIDPARFVSVNFRIDDVSPVR